MMISLTHGHSELSLAIADQDWIRVHHILENHPQQTYQWNVRHGFFEGMKDAHCLPLHEACVNSSTPNHVLEGIVYGNLDAVKTRESSYRRLPLHCLCRRRDSNTITIQMITLLIKVYPASCLVPDDLGRLPLHYALSNGADSSVIHCLLQANPKAAHGVDNRGWTPLHVACSHGTTTPVILELLSICPAAVVLHTKKGSTPLQCLNKNIPDYSRIKQILKDARIEFDRNFRCPLSTYRKTLLEENNDVVLV